MTAAVRWLENFFQGIPLQLLEVWGSFAFLVGCFLMVCAFTGVTFNPGSRWGFGRQIQTWDAKAFQSIIITFLAINLTGYLGSFIVLVPGAQTFESLKDLSVFVCILIFGYPALIIIPFAYGLSDLVEGVPVEYVKDWIIGYFINPSIFWIAYQLLGKNPDFRDFRKWKKYIVFVLLFLFLEPAVWGYICSGKFTSEISYRTVTPALVFTTSITWVLAPFVMILILPLARKLKGFWAEIPGYVKEVSISSKKRIWESGNGSVPLNTVGYGLPIRMFLVAPFVLLILILLGATSYFTLRSSEEAAGKLANHMQKAASLHLTYRLDIYLNNNLKEKKNLDTLKIREILNILEFSRFGRVFIADQDGKLIASSKANDLIAKNGIYTLFLNNNGKKITEPQTYRFDVLTAKPLARETWLGYALPYVDKSGMNYNWTIIMAVPETYYLEGVRIGNSQSAMIFAIALIFTLIISAILATLVTNPIIKISKATESLAAGDLNQLIPPSHLTELAVLANSFNNMTTQLQLSFVKLTREVDKRKTREQELEQSEARLKESEQRLQIATKAAGLGIWDWDMKNNVFLWDDNMFKLYGIPRGDTYVAPENWQNIILAEDRTRSMNQYLEVSLSGESEFLDEFRVRWPDGSIRHIKSCSKTLKDENNRAYRMVGINFDVTEQNETVEELVRYRKHLEELVSARTAALTIAKRQTEIANNAIKDQLAELEKAREQLVSRTAQLESSNKELESFSYSVSHDLRSPLRGIDGWSLALLEDYGDRLDDKGRTYLNRVRSETQRMGSLIDDLLKLAKITRKEIEWKKVNLTDLANIVILRLKEEYAGKKIKFNVHPDLTTQGDSHLFEILLTNLIGNSCKFTSKVDEAQIEFGKTIVNGKDVFFIKDNGAGFNMANAQNLFGAFQRLHKQSEFQGSGIGLAMVNRIINLHQGRVWAESEVNKGATFYFTINDYNA